MRSFLSAYAHDPSAYAPPADGLSVGDRRYLVDLAELTEAVAVMEAGVHESQDTDGVSVVTASRCTDATHSDATVAS